MAGSILSALKDNTKDLHTILNHHPMLQPLVLPGLDKTTYGRALQAFHGAFAILEEHVIDAVSKNLISFKPALRAHLLSRDLRALNLAAFPVTGSLKACDNKSSAVGLLYLLEGSRSGGKVIGTCVQQSLGGVPCAFFSPNADTSERESFGQYVEREKNIDAHEAIVYARNVFWFLMAHVDACHQMGLKEFRAR